MKFETGAWLWCHSGCRLEPEQFRQIFAQKPVSGSSAGMSMLPMMGMSKTRCVQARFHTRCLGAIRDSGKAVDPRSRNQQICVRKRPKVSPFEMPVIWHVMMIFLLTALTMVAFAANSLFARLALAEGAIDAGSYSILRLASGAIILTVLAVNFSATKIVAKPFETKMASVVERGGNWASALALLLYVAGFSFAYLALETGVGALILFACVQATMIGWGMVQGNRPSSLEWLGLAVAFGAFVYLVSPGLAAPDPLGTVLMVVAGIAWGVYSLRGRGAQNPLLETAGNFILASRLMVAALIVGWIIVALTRDQADDLPFTISAFGVGMAVISGAITSGLGYALWYRCLPLLAPTKASIVQLSVPAIATVGGVVFAGEDLTLRLTISSVLILGGVAIALLARSKT